MKYVQLKKLFHVNEAQCNELYQKRFNSESTRKLGIYLNNGYECFYQINEEVLYLIDRIYTINTWLEKTMASDAIPSLAKEYLVVRSLVEEIKSSNQMEGIYSTRKELKDMLIAKDIKRYKRFYGMVNKYKKLWKDNFKELKTVYEIRELYDEVLLQDVIEECKTDKPDGVLFRKDSVEINSGTKVIHNGITGEENIIIMLEKALEVQNDENINYLIKTAVFHYLFEYTHPFYNGNGRMGRFLACGYLSNNMNILGALQFSIACLHNNKKYYDAFLSTNDIRNKGDLTVFIIRFLEIYLSGLEELQETTANMIDDYKYTLSKMHKYVESKYVPVAELILQVTLFGIEGFNMSQLKDMTGYTEQSIRNIIKSINKKYAVIKVDKSSKPYRYQINLELLNILN